MAEKHGIARQPQTHTISIDAQLFVYDDECFCTIPSVLERNILCNDLRYGIGRLVEMKTTIS